MALTTTGLTQFGASVKEYLYCDQGKYFVATNPTPATGITLGNVTSLVTTTPAFLFQNNNPAASGIHCYLDHLWIEFTGIGSGWTAHRMTFKVDTTQSTQRYTSGGSTITAVNPNADSSATSKTNIYAGAITAAAEGSARLVESHLMRTVIPVIGDNHYFDFAPQQGQAMANLPQDGSLQVAKYYACAPIVVGPQEWFAAYIWGASMAGTSSVEFGLGWVEV